MKGFPIFVLVVVATFVIIKYVVFGTFSRMVLLGLAFVLLPALVLLTALAGLKFFRADKTILSRNKEAVRLAKKNNKRVPLSIVEKGTFNTFVSKGIIQTEPFMGEDGLEVHAFLSDSAKKELWNSQDRH